MHKKIWNYDDFGVKAELARRADMTPAYLNHILSRKYLPNIETARKLEAAAISMGLGVTRFDFIEADITPNPLFRPLEAQCV